MPRRYSPGGRVGHGWWNTPPRSRGQSGARHRAVAAHRQNVNRCCVNSNQLTLDAPLCRIRTRFAQFDDDPGTTDRLLRLAGRETPRLRRGIPCTPREQHCNLAEGDRLSMAGHSGCPEDGFHMRLVRFELRREVAQQLLGIGEERQRRGCGGPAAMRRLFVVPALLLAFAPAARAQPRAEPRKALASDNCRPASR